MAKVKLTFEGLEEYLALLKQAGEDVDKISEQALAAGADYLLAEMQAKAPTNTIKQNLRKTAIMADGSKRYLYIGILRTTPKDIAIRAATWEYGGRATPNPKFKKRINRPHFQMHPYVRPVLHNAYRVKKAKEVMADIFQEWLKK